MLWRLKMEFKITSQGKAFVQNVLQAGKVCVFKNIKTFENADFVNPKQVKEVTISKTDEYITVFALFNNVDLTEGYFIKGIEIYVSDGDSEILFASGTNVNNPDYMPAFNGKSQFSITYDYKFKVEDTENISLIVNPSGTATLTDIVRVEDKIDEHINEKIVNEKGSHGFKFFKDSFQCYDDAEKKWVDIETGGAEIGRASCRERV